MELRNWVQDRFGTTDTESLLYESVYSRNELRKDKSRLEHKLNETEDEMDEHHEKYQQLLEEGADKSDIKRKQYAQKAKFEKKKYKIKKKRYKANSIKLGTIISIEGMREIMDMQDEEDITLVNLLGDEVNARELQGEIMDQMAQFGLEIEDMQKVQDALDVQILDEDLEEGASEELELMREMEAGEVSREQVDVEDKVDVDADDVDVDFEETSAQL